MSREVNDAGGGRRERGREQARQIQERVAQFRGRRRTGMFGAPEIVALAAACALLAAAAAAYFMLLVPQRLRLSGLETERAQLQTQIRTASETRNTKVSTGETVSGILSSLEQFETQALAARETSINALYEELTEKPRRNGLARAQFSFVHQDEQAQSAQQQRASAASLAGGARRRQTVFPATDITLNIEGGYGNVRRFMRDVERSTRFVVINAVQLEGLNESGGDTRARGSLVTLRLDMSAYFRRNAMAAGATLATPGASQ